MRKTRKLLLMIAAGATMLAATPANAWQLYSYYYANGQWAGTRVYCDDGWTLIYSEGIATAHYIFENHPGEGPC